MNPTYDKLKKLTEDPIEEVLADVHVLFADDNIETLTLMEMWCREVGWNGVYVTTALGIVDEINKASLKGQGFDAIVADINFKTDGPDVTGITVARTIRKVRPEIPIIFVSAYVNSTIREEVRRVNAEVLTKPVDYDDLFQRIAELVYWHRIAVTTIEGQNPQSSITSSGWEKRRTSKEIEPPQNVLDAIGVSNKQ
jgi:CheY-like chemotaxis protein